MILAITALICGFVGLIISADKFSEAGAMLGNILKITPIVIGIVVFGFGTSAPEILVSFFAATTDNNDIAIGNALGSNIFNILLVLALSSIIAVVPFSAANLKKEYAILVIITLVVGLLLLDYHLGFIDGLILITLFFAFLYIELKTAANHLIDGATTNTQNKSTTRVIITLVISIIVLLISAKLVVYGGENIARLLGVSELVIGLTIISLGTSLPELALAIASSIKKQHQMLIGNILGSNIFNSTAVLSVVALINPDNIDELALRRDYLFVIIATLLIIVLGFRRNHNYNINKFGGVILITVLIFYLYNLL